MMMHNPASPGELLREFLGDKPVGEFAQHIGVARATVSRILNGRTSVTVDLSIRLGEALGFPSRRIETHDTLAALIRHTLEGDGPQLCEVMLDKAQPFAPKLSSRRLEDGRMVTSALEDLAPFLTREELADNMLIPLLES